MWASAPLHHITPPHTHNPIPLQVLLQMGETAFAGRYEPCRDDGLDCVAVFDGTTFRLERLGAVAKNLRCVGGGDGARGMQH